MNGVVRISEEIPRPRRLPSSPGPRPSFLPRRSSPLQLQLKLSLGRIFRHRYSTPSAESRTLLSCSGFAFLISLGLRGRKCPNGAYLYTFPVSAPSRPPTKGRPSYRFQALFLGDQIMYSTNSGGNLAGHESRNDFMPAEC
jgi:hypothetical protein